jgi:tripartite-type tricarboxylate transporter receptor subunit TctC
MQPPQGPCYDTNREVFPSRPVRLVVGFAAGGTQDVIARLLGQWLSERLGQQVIIENRACAASLLPPRR